MSVNPQYRCSVAGPGVEVVTARTDDDQHETVIMGGRLDGERFLSKTIRAALLHHEHAIELAKIADNQEKRRPSRLNKSAMVAYRICG
jgi:hypothetical protein